METSRPPFSDSTSTHKLKYKKAPNIFPLDQEARGLEKRGGRGSSRAIYSEYELCMMYSVRLMMVTRGGHVATPDTKRDRPSSSRQNERGQAKINLVRERWITERKRPTDLPAAAYGYTRYTLNFSSQKHTNQNWCPG